MNSLFILFFIPEICLLLSFILLLLFSFILILKWDSSEFITWFLLFLFKEHLQLLNFLQLLQFNLIFFLNSFIFIKFSLFIPKLLLSLLLSEFLQLIYLFLFHNLFHTIVLLLYTIWDIKRFLFWLFLFLRNYLVSLVSRSRFMILFVFVYISLWLQLLFVYISLNILFDGSMFLFFTECIWGYWWGRAMWFLWLIVRFSY